MTDAVLLDSAERIFSDHLSKDRLDAAERGEFQMPLWQALVDNGFAQLGLADSGFALEDLFAVLHLAGRHAVPLPLAEMLLGNRFVGHARDRVGIGVAAGDGNAQHCRQVPWGRSMDRVLVLPTERAQVDSAAALAAMTELGALDHLQLVTASSNLAGEPRDELSGQRGSTVQAARPFALLALARTVGMAGLLSRVLELALQYAQEREQFGRSISKFQAVQHNLAVAAAEVAAAQRASDAAIASLDAERFVLDLAIAKARVGEAAGIVAEIAHQVHGAMGFTHEHQLHHFTRRLWAWRDEFGHEGEWQALIGLAMAGAGADQLWSVIATNQ